MYVVSSSHGYCSSDVCVCVRAVVERLEEKHEALWSENKDLHVKHIVVSKEEGR